MKYSSFIAISLVCVAIIVGAIASEPWFNHEAVIYKTREHLFTQQQQIMNDVRLHSQIDDRLTTLLHAVPSAKSAYISMIHSQDSENTDPYSTEVDTDSATTTNSVAVLGQPSTIADKVSLTSWRDYIVPMTEHKCTYIPVTKITDPNAKTKLIVTKTFAVLVCPIFSVNNDLLGGLFLTWDKPEEVPCLIACKKDSENMHDVAVITKRTGTEIGNWLTSDLKKD